MPEKKSLVERTHELPAPEPYDYTRMFAIPLEERCDACEGLGKVRFRHSMYGNDWMKCWFCQGTGVAPPGVPTVKEKPNARK